MNTRKNFLHYLAQAINQYCADQRTSSAEETASSSPKPGRFRRALRWLTPNGGTLLLLAALLLTQNVWARQVAAPAAPGPSATTINYQSHLSGSDGTSLNGTVGLTFTIYDALTDGNVVWGPEEHQGVEVADGLLNVGLGSKTSGGIPTSVWNGDRYLEVAVNGQPLSPRELIRSVPIAGIALQAYTVPDRAIQTQHIDIGAVQSQNMAPTIFQAETSGEIQVNNGLNNDPVEVSTVDVDCPVDANYLIFFSVYTRHGTAGKRMITRLQDENFEQIGRAIVNSHSTAGFGGSQTGSMIATHFFTAGTHTLHLVASAEDPNNSYVRGSSIVVVPFAVAE